VDATGKISSPEQALDRMVRVINDGWLVTVLSLGERTGLHRALAREPAPVRAIADAAGCDERYTEVWLWAMASSGFVEVTGEGAQIRFGLAPGADRVLTSAGGPAHWSRITEQITAFATMEDHLVEAFHTGGGLPAALYEGRITEVLAAESTPILQRTVLQEVFPAFGLDVVADRGARIADLGCGNGELACLLAERFPRSTVLGLDQSADGIRSARGRARAAGLPNARFDVADLEDSLPAGGQDIVLAVNTAHDLSDPGRFFARVRERLRPGGVFYLVELASQPDMMRNIENEHALGILAFSLYHCLPLAKRRPGIAPGGMYGTQRYIDLLRAAGFGDVQVFRAPSDPTNDTVIARVGIEK
jgi:SAM-dependent methyltransferase